MQTMMRLDPCQQKRLCVCERERERAYHRQFDSPLSNVTYEERECATESVTPCEYNLSPIGLATTYPALHLHGGAKQFLLDTKYLRKQRILARNVRLHQFAIEVVYSTG